MFYIKRSYLKFFIRVLETKKAKLVRELTKHLQKDPELIKSREKHSHEIRSEGGSYFGEIYKGIKNIK